MQYNKCKTQDYVLALPFSPDPEKSTSHGNSFTNRNRYKSWKSGVLAPGPCILCTRGADERKPYNPDTIHATDYANGKKNKADTDAEKSPRYFNLIKKFQKRKTTYMCLCVCVIEWAEDISECFFPPHHLSKSSL